MMNQTYLYIISLLLVDLVMADDTYWCVCVAVLPSIFGTALLVGLIVLAVMCCKLRVSRNVQQHTIVSHRQSTRDVESQKSEEPVVVARPGVLQTVQSIKEEDNVVYPVAQTT